MKIYGFTFDSDGKVSNSYKVLVVGFGFKYRCDYFWTLHKLHVVFKLQSDIIGPYFGDSNYNVAKFEVTFVPDILCLCDFDN